MHLSRSVLLALAPLVVSAAPLSERTSVCIRSHSAQIAELAACGESAPFTGCLDKLDGQFTAVELEKCLVTSGCSEDIAAVGAETLMYLCDESHGRSNDLRKRQRGGKNNADDEEEEEDKLPAKDGRQQTEVGLPLLTPRDPR